MYGSLYVCGFVAYRALIEFRKIEYMHESKGSNVPCEEEEKLPRCAWMLSCCIYSHYVKISKD